MRSRLEKKNPLKISQEGRQQEISPHTQALLNGPFSSMTHVACIYTSHVYAINSMSPPHQSTPKLACQHLHPQSLDGHLFWSADMPLSRNSYHSSPKAVPRGTEPWSRHSGALCRHGRCYCCLPPAPTSACLLEHACEKWEHYLPYTPAG